MMDLNSSLTKAKGTAAFLLFLGSFWLYLRTSPPALAPYRDMGEMVSVAKTLGVAHPPGYPLYALLGKIFTWIPAATPSYRLNLLSVLGGSLACCFFFLFLTEVGVGIPLAFLGGLLWCAAQGFWIISIVTEMYSLHMAAAAFFFFLWARPTIPPERKYIFLAFLGGLLSGIRMDFLLLGPALAWAVVLEARKKEIRVPVLAGCAIAFLAGFSIYLFIYLRSGTHPFLNWNRPETLERFWGSLTRKTHGGTLDLLSTNYAPGELFWTDLKIYFEQVAREFTWIFWVLAAAGLAFLHQSRRDAFAVTLLGWAVSGPLFIYKANLPPNPHALAVLEAHFNLPNFFAFAWAVCGVSWIAGIRSWPPILKRAAWGGACAGLLFLILGPAGRIASKRNNFFGADYAKNVFRTLPKDSVLILQKDVQLFLFWAEQYAWGKRPDVSVVSRGLSGSPWFIETKREEGFPVVLGPLKTDSDFEQFLHQNPSKAIFAGWEEEIPFGGRILQTPRGLLRRLALSNAGSPRSKPEDLFLRDLYGYRGHYSYQKQHEFFSQDLIDDYSKAHFGSAVEWSAGEPGGAGALWNWNRSIALNSENPSSYYRRAFSFLERGDLERAGTDFERAARLYAAVSAKTREYHSLPDVARGVRAEWVECLLNLGVVREKQGRKQESESLYLQALDLDPASSRAHYNLAVLFWNRDWSRVARHLEETLRLDPRNSQAAAFLARARAAQRGVPLSK